MRTSIIALTCIALAIGMNTAGAATKYSVVKGLNIKSNPTGPWTYLFAGTPLPKSSKDFANIKRWIGWTNAQQIPNSAAIARNETGATITYLTIVDPVDHLNMDPEGNANVAVRFTVPTAGTYAITGDFRGNDTNEHSHGVEIDHNGAAAYTGALTSYGQLAKFKLKVTAAAGDTIDFLSKTGSDYSYLSTGLKATLTGP